MIQFQENAWTEGQMEERNDGKALFIGPFRLPPGVQKVQHWSNKKLLHYCQHAKNQFNL